MDALITSLLLAVIAGFGDRAQLFVAAMSVRFGATWRIYAAIAGASLLNCFIAAYCGALVSQWISVDAVLLFYALSLLFAAGGMLFFRPRVDALQGWRTGAFLTCWFGLLVLQFGDKGQFIIAATAARTHDPLLAALGGWIGTLAAFLPAAMLGERTGQILPVRAIRLGGGAILLIVGLVVALRAWGILA